VIAQHCIALSLAENLSPGGTPDVWSLWAKVADAMSNNDLKDKCLKQKEALETRNSSESSFEVSNRELYGMLRRAPWERKISPPTRKNERQTWYDGISFPVIPTN
jgi:hypothetical protein